MEDCYDAMKKIQFKKLSGMTLFHKFIQNFDSVSSLYFMCSCNDSESINTVLSLLYLRS
jgi:hypothetical protein